MKYKVTYSGFAYVEADSPEDEVLVRCQDPQGYEYTGMYSSRVHRNCWFKVDICGNCFIRRQAPTHWRPIEGM